MSQASRGSRSSSGRRSTISSSIISFLGLGGAPNQTHMGNKDPISYLILQYTRLWRMGSLFSRMHCTENRDGCHLLVLDEYNVRSHVDK